MMRAYISKDDDLKKEYWTQCDLPNFVLAKKVVSTIEVRTSSNKTSYLGMQSVAKALFFLFLPCKNFLQHVSCITINSNCSADYPLKIS